MTTRLRDAATSLCDYIERTGEMAYGALLDYSDKVRAALDAEEEMGDGSPDVKGQGPLTSAPDGAVSRHAALFGGPHPGCVNPYPHDPPACYTIRSGYQMAVNCTECNRKLADCDHVPGAVSRCDGSPGRRGLVKTPDSERDPDDFIGHMLCPGCPACRKEGE